MNIAFGGTDSVILELPAVPTTTLEYALPIPTDFCGSKCSTNPYSTLRSLTLLVLLKVNWFSNLWMDVPDAWADPADAL